MGHRLKLVGYSVGVFVLTALMLAWISHSSHVASPPEAAGGAPEPDPPSEIVTSWAGASPPSQSQTHNAEKPTLSETVAPAANQSAPPDTATTSNPSPFQTSTLSAYQSSPSEAAAPSEDQVSAPDSEQDMTPAKGSNAALRAAMAGKKR